MTLNVSLEAVACRENLTKKSKKMESFATMVNRFVAKLSILDVPETVAQRSSVKKVFLNLIRLGFLRVVPLISV